MPNTNPPTTSVEALHHKLDTAAEQSAAHYGFFVGATGENLDELNQAERTCGIKIFMGSSTGTLLVHREEELEETRGPAAVRLKKFFKPHSTEVPKIAKSLSHTFMSEKSRKTP